jgi:hypothetical protein
MLDGFERYLIDLYTKEELEEFRKERELKTKGKVEEYFKVVIVLSLLLIPLIITAVIIALL